MKPSLFCLLIPLLAGSAHAASLTCKRDDAGPMEDKQGADYTAVVADYVDAYCGQYSIRIEGIGLGARIALSSRFVIACPGSDDPRGVYYGLKADAAALFGLGGALYFGKQGVCAVGSGSFASFGADVTFSSLVIR
jgi:hypothetical protein